MITAGFAEPGFGGPAGAKTAVVKVKERAVEGESGVSAIVRIVEHPLADGAHQG
jgi:hypothetical protein